MQTDITVLKNKFFSVNNLSFSYPDSKIKAVDNISFSVGRGEYVALLGPNGSGKSTLARLIAGFLEANSGNVEFFDNKEKKYYKNNSTENVLQGIVFQSPRDQIVALTVRRDIAFGPENLNIAKPEIDKRITKTLQEVNMLEKIDSSTYALSLGQTQKLALSGILAMHPSLLILDESLSMIDAKTRSDILDYLDELNKKGITILHVTHDTDEARRAKRIIALEEGKVFFEGTPDDILKNRHLEIKLFGEPLMRTTSLFADDKTNEEIVFKMEDICFSYEDALYSKQKKSIAKKNAQENNILPKLLFKDFSLALKKGTLTALVGASGSGKSTMFEIACGLLRARSGKIFATSMPAFALQDCESALFEEFAADDVAFAPQNIGKKGKALKECVKNAMNLAGLPFEIFADRRTKHLSGGEKRKLSLAGVIALDSDILFFDEPTSALDPASRRSIMHTLKKLCEDGKTILFSTHRLDEAAFADRCVTLENGKLVEDTEGFWQTKIIKAKLIDDIKTEQNILQADLQEISAHAQTVILEKMQKVKIGEYEKKSSFIHKMKPMWKYVLFFAIFIFGLCVNSYIGLIVANLIAIIYTLLGKYSLKKMFVRVLRVVPWIMFFLIFQFLFFKTGTNDTIYFQYGFFSISLDKLHLSAKTLLHCICAILAFSVFAYTTNEEEIIEGIKDLLKPLKKIGVPSHYVAMVIGVIFRFIPVLTQEASLIIKAQIVRGGLKDEKGFFARIKSMLPLFVPLILQTLKRATALGDTLTARHFR
ncbi:MAG: ATP-binding cassette domain-containing protein [Treponema sp.]|nr:ATP-binding cassette domain-containing protein [Treponema sp.]